MQVLLLPVSEAECDHLLLDLWAELHREALEPNPFFAPEMVLPAARHLEHGASAKLLLGENAGRLVFLVPVAGPTGMRWGRSLVLRPWMHDYCFLGTPLIHGQADPHEVWAGVLTRMQAATGTSLLMLRMMVSNGAVSRALNDVAGCSPDSVTQFNSGFRPFVRRRPEPTYLVDWMSRKSHANLARKRRRLSRQLNAEVRVVDRAESDPGVAADEFLRIEAGGWKGRAGTAMLCRPGHDSFFREVISGFAGEGRLMMLSLQAGTRVVAQNTALLGGGGLFGFKKAYDEAHAEASPGTQLDVEVLDWFHRTRGLDWIDSCAATSPDRCDGIFGDRRSIGTYAVPTTRLGSGLVAAIPTARKVHHYVRDVRARALARTRG
jgi:CelD/BcsL family acetyltransferase involved in cellulose biosynthesis